MQEMIVSAQFMTQIQREKEEESNSLGKGCSSARIGAAGGGEERSVISRSQLLFFSSRLSLLAGKRMPPISRVSSSSLILAIDSQILVYSLQDAQLIKNVEIPAIALNDSDPQSKNGKMAGKGTAERLEILMGQFSPDGSLFCLADSYKRLLVYETASWNLIKEFATERKGSLITFDTIGNQILVTDRTGDVYLFDMDKKETSTTGKLLMGHLSIILALEVTPDNRFVITADRDEKIRVSRFPNSHTIESFCLGHTEFVSSVVVLDNKRLISGSGDGTIKMWTFIDGQLITSVNCGEDHSVKQILRLTSGAVVVSFYCIKVVKLYSITDNEIVEQRVIDVHDEIISMEEVLDQESVILLLLTRCQEQPFLLISLSKDSSSSRWHESIQCLLNSIHSLDEFTKCLTRSESDVQQLKLLKKEAYDNVEKYLMRKQERLQKEDHHKKRIRLTQSSEQPVDSVKLE